MNILCCCCLRKIIPNSERKLSSQTEVVTTQVKSSPSIQSLFWFDDLVTEQQLQFEEMFPPSPPMKRFTNHESLSNYDTSSLMLDFSRCSARSYDFNRNHFRNTFYRNLIIRKSLRSGRLDSSLFSRLDSDVMSVDSVFSDSSIGLYEYNLDMYVSQTDPKNCVPNYYRITYISDEDIPLLSSSDFPYFPSYTVDSDCEITNDGCFEDDFSEDDSGFYFDEGE